MLVLGVGPPADGEALGQEDNPLGGSGSLQTTPEFLLVVIVLQPGRTQVTVSPQYEITLVAMLLLPQVAPLLHVLLTGDNTLLLYLRQTPTAALLLRGGRRTGLHGCPAGSVLLTAQDTRHREGERSPEGWPLCCAYRAMHGTRRRPTFPLPVNETQRSPSSASQRREFTGHTWHCV